MKNFIVILENGGICHGAGYTPMLKRIEEERKVERVIDISNPTEPREKMGGKWVKLPVVG